jgi:two-component system, OmpR family, response regulator
MVSLTTTAPRRTGLNVAPQRQILIVDSDPSAALVTQRGLQMLLGGAAHVELASSPGAAWLRCVRDGVDLLIVDPSPQSRGASALIKALHEERPSIAVLVLTAYDTPRLRNQMRALGVRHYLAKPTDLLDLQQSVKHALEGEAHTDATHAPETTAHPASKSE